MDGQAAIDHCQIHGWPLEEALALELHGMYTESPQGFDQR